MLFCFSKNTPLGKLPEIKIAAKVEEVVDETPKEAIAPGAKGTITVKYDTKRPGAINKSVTITSNAVNEPTKVIRIKGTVSAAPANGTPVNKTGPAN